MNERTAVRLEITKALIAAGHLQPGRPIPDAFFEAAGLLAHSVETGHFFPEDFRRAWAAGSVASNESGEKTPSSSAAPSNH